MKLRNMRSRPFLLSALLISCTSLVSFLTVDTAGAKNTVIATIPVGGQSSGIVAAPDNKAVYVVNSTNISAIDTKQNKVTKTFPSGVSFGTAGLAISPDGQTLYCALEGYNTLQVISIASGTVTQTFAVGNLPGTPAVSPDGALIYVPNFNDGTVTVISNGAVQATIAVGGSPDGVVFSPDGSTAYVAGGIGGDDGTGYVVLVNTATETVAATITLPTPVNGAVISPNGSILYCPGNNAVYAVDSKTETIVDTFSYPGKDGAVNLLGYSALLSVNDEPIYVPVAGQLVNGNFEEGNTVIVFNTISPIDTEPVDIIHLDKKTDGKLKISKITVGNVPIKIAVTPNEKLVYVANEYDGTVSVIKR
jgi:YVTN family beta-propeller protein